MSGFPARRHAAQNSWAGIDPAQQAGQVDDWTARLVDNSSEIQKTSRARGWRYWRSRPKSRLHFFRYAPNMIPVLFGPAYREH